jgi:hypothetical protein
MTLRRQPYRLVLIDGLPGSGKSTAAHSLGMHLQRHGYSARWCWELEVPHPIFEFQEAIEAGALRDGFLEGALERWRAVAVDLASADETLILESSFLQSAVQPMFALDWSPARIGAFLHGVVDAITPAKPFLAVLRYDDVEAALEAVARVRGTSYLQLIESKVTDTPYAQARGLSGLSGTIEYLSAYQAVVDGLVATLELPSMTVAARDGVPAAVARIADALALPPFEPFETTVSDLAMFVGDYRRADAEGLCRIVTDGRDLYVDDSPKARLVQRAARRFEIVGTCLQFEFHGAEGQPMDRLECRGNFPGMPPLWVRVE